MARRIRQVSSRRRQRMKEAKELRNSLVEEQDRRCMNCGAGPRDWRRGPDFDHPTVHEILNGPLRDKTLDEPCSLLVLCWHCNAEEFTDKNRWPVARQLALLLTMAPQHYDLERFCWLRNPQAPGYVVQSEVDAYLPELAHKKRT